MFNRIILRSRDEFHSLILRSDKRRGEKILPERVESRLSEFENANLTSRAVNEEVVNREPIFCPPVPRFSILFSPLPGSFATRPSRNLL